jgi:hypothetical protein
MKKIILLLLIILSLTVAGTSTSESSKKQKMSKPKAPLKVSIISLNPAITPESIKSGNIIELKIIVLPEMDAKEMHIAVGLIDGAELVSGETSWHGEAKKGIEKVLKIIVRASAAGGGKIRGHAVIPVKDVGAFSAEAIYIIGQDISKKNMPKPPVRKDSRGQDIIEYKVK